MGAAPLFPEINPCQYASRLFPIGVSAPNHVTTTLFNTIVFARIIDGGKLKKIIHAAKTTWIIVCFWGPQRGMLT